MKYIILILIILLSFNSCSDSTNKIENKKNKKDQTFQLFVQNIITDKRFTDYYNLTKERETIVLIENEKIGITRDLNINYLNEPIKWISNNSEHKFNVVFYFDSIKKKNDSIIIKYFFQFYDENIKCATYYIKNKNTWVKGDTRMAIIN